MLVTADDHALQPVASSFDQMYLNDGVKFPGHELVVHVQFAAFADAVFTEAIGALGAVIGTTKDETGPVVTLLTYSFVMKQRVCA